MKMKPGKAWRLRYFSFVFELMRDDYAKRMWQLGHSPRIFDSLQARMKGRCDGHSIYRRDLQVVSTMLGDDQACFEFFLLRGGLQADREEGARMLFDWIDKQNAENKKHASDMKYRMGVDWVDASDKRYWHL